MEKKELKKALSQSANGAMMMTPSDLCRFLGKSPEYVRRLMYGTDHIGTGKSKMYFVGDIADRLIEARRI